MPDNAIYYHLAYAATAIIFAFYGISLAWRARQLDAQDTQERDEERAG
jgi:hypothetical protein